MNPAAGEGRSAARSETLELPAGLELQPCSVCSAPPSSLDLMLYVGDIPNSPGRLAATSTEAIQTDRGEIVLASCQRCGAVQNAGALPLHAGVVEFGRRGAPIVDARLREYQQALAQQLVRGRNLDDADVVELFAGSGELLRAIASRCTARCIGFAASNKSREQPLPNLRLINDTYSLLRFEACHADLVISRHVLEHAWCPIGAVLDMRSALRSSGHFYVQVVHADHALQGREVWDLNPERRTYFTPQTLERLLRDGGLAPTKIYSALGGRLLCAEGKRAADPSQLTPDEPLEHTVSTAPAAVRGLKRSLDESILRWNDLLVQRVASGDRVAIWGSGPRTTTFLNVVPGGRDVAAVVATEDCTRDGYVPGTAQRVVQPETLRELAIDVVVVVDPSDRPEAEARLRDLGLRCELISVGKRGGR